MKILVFEYICGGGLAGQVLPASLAAEGGMMLQALVDDLKSLPALNLLVPLDKRCLPPSLPAGAEIVLIGDGQDAISLLPDLINQCDAVWPIAPETDGLLASIAEMTAARHKTLLLSSSEAVALCSDKLATYQVLSAHRIPAVETRALLDLDTSCHTRWVIKPADGVGCQGGMIVENPEEFRRALDSLKYPKDMVNNNFPELVGNLPPLPSGEGWGEGVKITIPNVKSGSYFLPDPKQYVVQPYYAGRAVSLSCLFKQGKGWLLCCNQQQIEIGNSQFVLRGCLVNVQSPYQKFYQNLVERIAAAIPDLWGYIGIDLIETQDHGPLVLEINPRLTTSYAGIRQATGINVAEQVLSLLQAEPDLRQYCNQSVEIAIN